MRAIKTLGLLGLLVSGAGLAHSPAPTHGPAHPPSAEVTALMTKALPDYPGKQAEMITVTYPPGSVDPVHRHNAHAFVYVLEGTVAIAGTTIEAGSLAVLSPGTSVTATSAGGGRFLLVAGTPLREPVARRGPYVMTTEAELDQAFADYQSGHLTDDPECVDLLYDGSEFIELPGPRFDTPNTHGGGDTMAASIAAALARGRTLPDAVRFGKWFVSEAVRHSYPLGHGVGPVSPFWRLPDDPLP